MPERPGPDEDLLPCGAPVSDLVDQADAGRLEPADAHQAGCPHCLAALRDAATTDRALGLLRAERGPLPTGLVDRVMRGVRRARPSPDLLDVAVAAAGQARGSVRVHRQVVADIARAAAATHPGVSVVRSVAAAAADDDAPGLQVSLGLLVDGLTPLPQLARTVRRSVRSALHRSTGLGDVRVDLAALDLVPGGRLGQVSGRPELLAPDGV